MNLEPVYEDGEPDIKQEVHQMINTLNRIATDDFQISPEDKHILINQFKEEILPCIDKTDELYVDIITVLTRLGIKLEELEDGTENN